MLNLRSIWLGYFRLVGSCALEMEADLTRFDLGNKVDAVSSLLILMST